jgi:cell division protein FtsB
MTYAFHTITFAILAFTLFTAAHHGKALMSTQETVDQVIAQLKKARAEIVAARDALNANITDLQNQLTAAGVAEQVDLTELQNVAQTLDELNPDA